MSITQSPELKSTTHYPQIIRSLGETAHQSKMQKQRTKTKEGHRKRQMIVKFNNQDDLLLLLKVAFPFNRSQIQDSTQALFCNHSLNLTCAPTVSSLYNWYQWLAASAPKVNPTTAPKAKDSTVPAKRIRDIHLFGERQSPLALFPFSTRKMLEQVNVSF